MPGVTQPGLQQSAPAQPRPSVPHRAPCRRQFVASAAALALLSAQSECVLLVRSSLPAGQALTLVCHCPGPARADFASDARAKLSAGEKVLSRVLPQPLLLMSLAELRCIQAFADSDLLKALREKSDTNRVKCALCHEAASALQHCLLVAEVCNGAGTRLRSPTSTATGRQRLAWATALGCGWVTTPVWLHCWSACVASAVLHAPCWRAIPACADSLAWCSSYQEQRRAAGRSRQSGSRRCPSTQRISQQRRRGQRATRSEELWGLLCMYHGETAMR